jgi:topoisomerase IV subunit B
MSNQIAPSFLALDADTAMVGSTQASAKTSSKTNTAANAYGESAIKVLKGLEPVKQRPGMYTRTENPLHIVQEVIDNACDEALAGYGKRIEVVLNGDASITVSDYGRGIPCGIHPEEGVSVLEIVFTRLHAGGKFDKTAGGAYTFAGGLHGVGASVSNALSTRLQVTVWREKQCHTLVFSGGDIIEPLVSIPRKISDPKQGTQVRLWPDAQYFDSPNMPIAELERLLRSKAVLLPGVTFALTDAKSHMQEWAYDKGMQAYLEAELSSDPLIPYWGGEVYMPVGHEHFAQGEGAQWLVVWTQEGGTVRESYVNLIHTAAGGTHESGLKDGLFTAVKAFCELHKLLPKGIKLLPEDVFSRASFVLSTRVLDPQFQGQTKERLNSRDALRLVSTCIKPAFDLWLNQHIEHGKLLADLCIRQAQSRSRAAQKVEKRKSSSVAVLPGKLTDCESTDLVRNELFLVEGDSAGGSAKMGRDKHTQAVLPLRGKVLNTWEVERDRLFANNEIHDIAVALGIDPHSADDAVDFSHLRYGKLCILSDADVDGSHIQVLLLTLLYKHFPQMISRGHVFVSQPPLYRVDVPARAKKPAQKRYCLDEGERNAVLDKLRKEGFNDSSISISRFKGLGEMTPEQLWDTTLNPETRRLVRVDYSVDMPACDELGEPLQQMSSDALMFEKLMAKGESAARKTWLEEKGNLVEVDI